MGTQAATTEMMYFHKANPCNRETAASLRRAAAVLNFVLNYSHRSLTLTGVGAEVNFHGAQWCIIVPLILLF